MIYFEIWQCSLDVLRTEKAGTELNLWVRFPSFFQMVWKCYPTMEMMSLPQMTSIWYLEYSHAECLGCKSWACRKSYCCCWMLWKMSWTHQTTFQFLPRLSVGRLIAIIFLKVLSKHLQPQTRGCGWYFSVSGSAELVTMEWKLEGTGGEASLWLIYGLWVDDSLRNYRCLLMFQVS